jgi:hypothetical protein
LHRIPKYRFNIILQIDSGRICSDSDTPQRDRKPGFTFPPLAKIDDLDTVIFRIDEPTLVNDQPGIIITTYFQLESSSLQ